MKRLIIRENTIDNSNLKCVVPISINYTLILQKRFKLFHFKLWWYDFMEIKTMSSKNKLYSWALKNGFNISNK